MREFGKSRESFAGLGKVKARSFGLPRSFPLLTELIPQPLKMPDPGKLGW